MRVQSGSLGALPEVRDVEIYALAVSPRGDRLAIGDAFGEIQLLELPTRRRIGAIPARSPASSAGTRPGAGTA